MPPKRPRIAPSQTDLSVQDVRDYSTPDGAAMANEEMRRLKIALQKVQEGQEQLVTAITGPGAVVTGGEGDIIVPPVVSYSWFVKAENYTSAEVKDKETVVFRGIDGIRVSQVGKTITIGMPPVAWIVRGNTGSHSVKTTTTLRIVGINGVTTSVDTGIATLTIDRPLTIYERSRPIGNAGTIGIDFWGDANYIKKHENNKIHFHVQDVGNGIRRVTGYYVAGGGSGTMSTWVASDSVNTYVVNNSNTVEWVGINGVVVTLYPSNTPYPRFEIDRPLQMQQSNTNIGGVDTTYINMDNATLTKPLGHNSRVWTEVVDDGGGKRSLRFYYDPAGITTTSLQIQQRSIDIGGNDTGILNFDNEVTRKPDNYTGRVYAQVVDDQNGKRSVRLWHTPGDLNFSKWRVAASGTSGDADVLNNELVRFIGQSGINVARDSNPTGTIDDIYISVDSETWNNGNPPNIFVVSGILDFENSNNHYTWQDYNPTAIPTLTAKPQYLYGYRKYVDVVHGWNLNNLNNIEVHLLDISLEKDTETYLAYYRDGATTMSGEVVPTPPTTGRYAGKSIQRFRNFPFWTALDKNTVRFFATMSRNKPTHMKFKYSIKRV